MFHFVAKILLEVACVRPRSYSMPKQRAGLIIATYEREKIDWGWITGIALSAQLHRARKGKPMNRFLHGG